MTGDCGRGGAVNRRDFLKTTGAAAILPSVLPKRSFADEAHSRCQAALAALPPWQCTYSHRMIPGTEQGFFRAYEFDYMINGEVVHKVTTSLHCQECSDYRATIYPLLSLELGAASDEDCLRAAERAPVREFYKRKLYKRLRARCNRKGWLGPGDVVDLMHSGGFRHGNLCRLAKEARA